MNFTNGLIDKNNLSKKLSLVICDLWSVDESDNNNFIDGFIDGQNA
jgi:hypothetical protein